MDKDRHGLESDPGVVLTLLREGRHVLRSHDPSTNADVRKPVIYHDLVESIEQVECFLDTVDQAPWDEGWRR
jgi:hypothetical protein